MQEIKSTKTVIFKNDKKCKKKHKIEFLLFETLPYERCFCNIYKNPRPKATTIYTYTRRCDTHNLKHKNRYL
jgi:hypothetical protein